MVSEHVERHSKVPPRPPETGSTTTTPSSLRREIGAEPGERPEHRKHPHSHSDIERDCSARKQHQLWSPAAAWTAAPRIRRPPAGELRHIQHEPGLLACSPVRDPATGQSRRLAMTAGSAPTKIALNGWSPPADAHTPAAPGAIHTPGLLAPLRLLCLRQVGARLELLTIYQVVSLPLVRGRVKPSIVAERRSPPHCPIPGRVGPASERSPRRAGSEG